MSNQSSTFCYIFWGIDIQLSFNIYFNSQTLVNDIALIRLSKNFTRTRGVSPIPLPASNFVINATGWYFVNVLPDFMDFIDVMDSLKFRCIFKFNITLIQEMLRLGAGARLHTEIQTFHRLFLK